MPRDVQFTTKGLMEAVYMSVRYGDYTRPGIEEDATWMNQHTLDSKFGELFSHAIVCSVFFIATCDGVRLL